MCLIPSSRRLFGEASSTCSKHRLGSYAGRYMCTAHRVGTPRPYLYRPTAGSPRLASAVKELRLPVQTRFRTEEIATSNTDLLL